MNVLFSVPAVAAEGALRPPNRVFPQAVRSAHNESVKTLNEVYSPLSARRRYEVWFIRLGLADGSGAWWFRYLLMNPGRNGCPGDKQDCRCKCGPRVSPDGKPQSFIQGFPLEGLDLSARKQNPFHFRSGKNEIGENFCRGALEVDGHTISWELRWRSTFHVTISNKGWIGFSRTPHSDAFLPGRSRSMAGVLRETPWDLECKATIVDTGIVTSGRGRMPIFPAQMGAQPH